MKPNKYFKKQQQYIFSETTNKRYTSHNCFCSLLSFSWHWGDDFTPVHRCPCHSSSLLDIVLEYATAPDSVALSHCWTCKLFLSFCCYKQFLASWHLPCERSCLSPRSTLRHEIVVSKGWCICHYNKLPSKMVLPLTVSQQSVKSLYFIFFKT